MGPTSKGRDGVKGEVGKREWEGKMRKKGRRRDNEGGRGRGKLKERRRDLPDQCQTASYAPVNVSSFKQYSGNQRTVRRRQRTASWH